VLAARRARRQLRRPPGPGPARGPRGLTRSSRRCASSASDYDLAAAGPLQPPPRRRRHRRPIGGRLGRRIGRLHRPARGRAHCRVKLID
jgi:hypothetical protein